MRVDWLRRHAYRTVAKHDLDPTLIRSWITPLLTAPQVRRDTASFVKAIDYHDTMRAAEKLRDLQRPVLLLWPRRLPYFPFAHAQRWLRVLCPTHGWWRYPTVTRASATTNRSSPPIGIRFIDHDVPQAQA